MPASQSTNTQACTLDTEHALATISTAGVFVLDLDVNALAAADVLLVRAKKKVRTGGTTRLLDQWTIGGATPPVEKVFTTYPINSLWELVFTIEWTDGTAGSIPWEVTQVDA